MRDERRRLEELPPQEAMRLLGSVSLGRIVFTARALPAVRLASHLGWSVTVVGLARQVTDPDAAAAFYRALGPGADSGKDQVISIHASLITGFRLAAGGAATSAGSDGTDAAETD
jgi:hypothetical protein